MGNNDKMVILGDAILAINKARRMLLGKDVDTKTGRAALRALEDAAQACCDHLAAIQESEDEENEY